MPDQLWFHLDGRPMSKGLNPPPEAMKKATDGWTYYILNDTLDRELRWRLTRWRSQVKGDLGHFPHTSKGWGMAYDEILVYERNGHPARDHAPNTQRKPRGARQPELCAECNTEHAGGCPW
jgi:hypothetical protein